MGELSEFSVGGGTPDTKNPDFWGGDLPWLQSSDFQEHNLLTVIPKKCITSDGLEKSAAKFIPKDSIAVVTRIGVGKLALIPFDFATSQDLLTMVNLKLDLLFCLYGIYRKIQSEINTLQGTSIKGITKFTLLDSTLKVSLSGKEQMRIGALFKGLDFIVTLQQRKCGQPVKACPHYRGEN